MTYTPSHLGMAAILFFTVFPKRYRNWAKEHPLYFFLLTIVAILPDVDIYLDIPHRTWTHSLFVIAGSGITLYLISLHPRFSSRSNVVPMVIFFWLTHIFFDLTFDSVAIFYPLDKAFYKFVGGVVINVSTSPPSITQIFLERELINPRNGVEQFFVNWSAERRVNYFGGEEIRLAISQFTVHVAIFLYYVVKVVKPALTPLTNKITVPVKLFSIGGFALLDTIRRHLLLNSLLVFLVVSFIYAGPLVGRSYVVYDQTRTGLYVLSDGMTVYSELTFEIPERSSAEISIQFPTHGLNFSVAFGNPSNSYRDFIQSNISSLSANMESGNITLLDLHRELQKTLKEDIPSSWLTVPVGPKNPQSYVINLPYNDSKRTYSIGFVLLSWNVGDFFIYGIELNMAFTTSRANEVASALSYAYFTTVLLLVVNTSFYIWNKKIKKNVQGTVIH